MLSLPPNGSPGAGAPPTLPLPQHWVSAPSQLLLVPLASPMVQMESLSGGRPLQVGAVVAQPSKASRKWRSPVCPRERDAEGAPAPACMSWRGRRAPREPCLRVTPWVLYSACRGRERLRYSRAYTWRYRLQGSGRWLHGSIAQDSAASLHCCLGEYTALDSTGSRGRGVGTHAGAGKMAGIEW